MGYLLFLGAGPSDHTRSDGKANLLIARYIVADRSMEPVLVSGDRLVCGPTRKWVRRGALVVFPHPLRPEMSMVKRAVGLAGEVITLDFGEVLVDGRGRIDHWGAGATFPEGQWIVGPGEIFVLSDNRTSTLDDSRHFGPVSLSRVAPVIWHHRPRVHR